MRIPAKAEPFMYVDTYLQEYEQKKKKLVFNLFQTCLVEVQFLQIFIKIPMQTRTFRFQN